MTNAEIRLRCLEIVKDRGLRAGAVLQLDEVKRAALELEDFVLEANDVAPRRPSRPKP